MRDLLEIGLLVDEIVGLIGNFQFVFCNHVPKGCILLARALASDALAKAGPSVCFEDYPPCLQSLHLRITSSIKYLLSLYQKKKKKKKLGQGREYEEQTFCERAA